MSICVDDVLPVMNLTSITKTNADSDIAQETKNLLHALTLRVKHSI